MIFFSYCICLIFIFCRLQVFTSNQIIPH
jgi:hypothetical protein